MRTKVTDRRFPGCSMKSKAPVILPTVGNLYDLCCNEEDSRSSTGLEIVEIGLENETITTSKNMSENNASTSTKSVSASQSDGTVPGVAQQRKRKTTPLKQLQTKRARTLSPVYVDKDEVPFWEVERVIGKRMEKDQPEYLVKWAGCSLEENSWEPMTSFHPLTMECVWEYEYYLEDLKKGKPTGFSQNAYKNLLQGNTSTISPPQNTSGKM